MTDFIKALAELVENVSQLTPLGLFGLCIVLAFVSAAAFPTYTWIFVIASVLSGVILGAWIWVKITDR